MNGNRIKKKRVALNLSQQELANIAGVSLHTVFRAEKGTNIQSKNLQAIAAALNTTVAYLMGETEDSSLPSAGSIERTMANLSEKHNLVAEQRKKTYPRPTTLEDIVRARESSRNLQLLEDRDLKAAVEMARAMLEAIEKESAIRTAQQDGVAKSA